LLIEPDQANRLLPLHIKTGQEEADHCADGNGGNLRLDQIRDQSHNKGGHKDQRKIFSDFEFQVRPGKLTRHPIPHGRFCHPAVQPIGSRTTSATRPVSGLRLFLLQVASQAFLNDRSVAGNGDHRAYDQKKQEYYSTAY
jgi:hypothetical protein